MEMGMTILLMVMIGAIIGGFTNHLAIKMLFRPYKAIYVGKWRVPFTPGIIPKRRDELASQLGIMVVNHLLTPQSIKKKFLNETFQQEMIKLTHSELDKVLSNEITPEELFTKLGMTNSKEWLTNETHILVEKQYEVWMEYFRQQPIKGVISSRILEKLDEKIPTMSQYILRKGVDFFQSDEGERRIQAMIQEFAKGRSGMVGNMLQMVLGNMNVAGMIQKELIKFLESESTNELITTLLQQELDKVLNWDVEQVEGLLGREELINATKKLALKVIKWDQLLDTPITHFTLTYKEQLLEYVPVKVVELLGSWLSNRIEDIMERLHLAEVVREQVESFSVERIEEMVLLITSRELKMITYLGALLGGVIGLLQGIIVIFIT